ncbi:MAG: Rid family detoxifying hydrolase [Gracilimonas sp.]
MKTFILFLFITGFSSLSCTQQDRTTSLKRIIQTDNAPAAVGVYSQAIQIGNMLYVSGQIGLIPENRQLAGDDLESQTRQTLDNIRSVLDAADFEMTDVVKAQVFLDDMDDYGAFNEIYLEYFPENPPARAVVEVSRIPMDAKVEIIVEAVK